MAGERERERDGGWKEVSGGWGGKRGIQLDLMGTAAHIFSLQFSDPSFHLCFITQSPRFFSRILGDARGRNETKKKQQKTRTHTERSALFSFSSFVSSCSLNLLFSFKVFSHQRPPALPSCEAEPQAFLSKCTEKLLHLNMCLMVWLPQFMTGSNLCAAVLFLLSWFYGRERCWCTAQRCFWLFDPVILVFSRALESRLKCLNIHGLQRINPARCWSPDFPCYATIPSKCLFGTAYNPKVRPKTLTLKGVC